MPLDRQQHDPVAIVSPDGGLRAVFHPSLNMLCSSLLHEGVELLHLRSGIDAYAERGKTCGIPFLHPWANRLSSDRYAAGGRTVELRDGPRPIPRDANGLPNHGLLGGRTHWNIDSRADSSLVASFDFTNPELLAGFPFPHRVELRAEVAGDALAITTTVIATSEAPVPVSFGFHPYLRLPGVPREQWIVSMPVTRHLRLDSLSIPTGEVEAVEFPRAPLGTRTFDDGYTGIVEPRRFTIEGPSRRIHVEFGEHYPYAQVFAPAGSDFLCVEPMTAPANALVSGAGPLRHAAPEQPFTARFRIAIEG